MRYRFLSLALLLHLYSFISSAQSFTKENLLKDIDVYRDSITMHHPDPFTRMSRNEFFKELQKIKKSPGYTNADELLVALMKVNAKINDEQTGFSFDNPVILPLQAYWFEDGIYILKTDQAHKAILGTKLIAIEGTPVDKIVKQISAIIPGSDKQIIKNAVPQFIISPDILHGLKIINDPKKVTVKVMKDNGDTVNVALIPAGRINIKLERLELPSVPLRYAAGSQSYWYKYDSSANFLYFSYALCYQSKKHPFSDFQKHLLNTIDSSNPGKLVIDLRENGGGDAAILKPFIEVLAASKLNAKGKIYVLTGRRTYDAALQNAREIKEKTKAIFVGEPTSGNVNGFTNPYSFYLPATKLKLSHATKKLPSQLNYDAGISPDVNVPEKFSDFKKGYDAVLEYVIAQ